MRGLAWLVREISFAHSRWQRRRRIGEGEALYRLEPEDFASAGRRVGMQGLIDRGPDIVVLMEFNRERSADPAGLLRAIAARFPLRQLGANARVSPVTEAEALGRAGDTLLVLSRRAV